MKALILYHPNSEHERRVIDYTREFKSRTGKDIELVSLDTPEGSNKARVYDVTAYPALMACKEDGQLLQLWQDEQLPLINEVLAYIRS